MSEKSSNLNSIEVTINELVASVNNASYDNYVAVMDLHGPFRSNEVPIRSNAIFICICTRGSAKIGLSLKEFTLHTNEAFAVPKDFIARFEATDEFIGRILVFSIPIMQLIMPKLSDLVPFMIDHPVTPVLSMTETEKENLLEYFNLIHKRIGYEWSPFKKKKIVGLLQAVTFEIMEIQHKDHPKGNPKRSRKEEIMANFIISLRENFRKHREVSFYANELCVTPKHLSAVVKEISGRSAGEWIGQYVIMESKVLLKTTSHTIQEISTLLNFPNQSFFGKYFKHIAGISPSAFRNSDY